MRRSTFTEEEVSATSIALTFEIDQGNRSRIVEIDFEGNEHFKDGELRGRSAAGKGNRHDLPVQGPGHSGSRKLQYDLQKNVRSLYVLEGLFPGPHRRPESSGLG